MKRIAALFLATAILASAGCLHSPSSLIHRPKDVAMDEAVTARWAAEVRRHARHGDWLLTRSYTQLSDAIVQLTPGDDFSHGSIYDAERDMIIEAIDTGVREIPLERLMKRTDDVMIVRANVSDAERARAVERARSKIGTPYDTRGLFGIQDPDKFYCSELVLWSIDSRMGDEIVVTPADLIKYGRTVWYSGTRADSVRIIRKERMAKR